jgi:hypothetical protein
MLKAFENNISLLAIIDQLVNWSIIDLEDTAFL